MVSVLKVFQVIFSIYYKCLLLSIDGKIEVGTIEHDKINKTCFLTIKGTDSTEFHRTKSLDEAVAYFNNLAFFFSVNKARKFDIKVLKLKE